MRIGRTSMHTAWDNALPPIADIAPGTELTVETAESSGGQLGRGSGAADVGALDFGRVNPVTGPFRVGGAGPGDALVIDVLDVETGDWGWTACIPGFGLLADDFPEAHLRISAISGGFAEPLPGVRVPVVPMVGTIGVAPAAPLPAAGARVGPRVGRRGAAPAEPGEHSIAPPRRWGGNMDVRHVGPGARLVLPVGVEGALLSLGDAHAAMGDGEICGTGI